MTGCYFDSLCALVPYGVGTGTGAGAGTGAGVLPGAKPLKPPGVCLCACISALNKTLHPKYIQRVISSLHTLFHVKALTLLCCGFVLQWVEQEVELESHWQQEVIKVRTHLRFM